MENPTIEEFYSDLGRYLKKISNRDLFNFLKENDIQIPWSNNTENYFIKNPIEETRNNLIDYVKQIEIIKYLIYKFFMEKNKQ